MVQEVNLSEENKEESHMAADANNEDDDEIETSDLGRPRSPPEVSVK